MSNASQNSDYPKSKVDESLESIQENLEQLRHNIAQINRKAHSSEDKSRSTSFGRSKLFENTQFPMG